MTTYFLFRRPNFIDTFNWDNDGKEKTENGTYLQTMEAPQAESEEKWSTF